MASVRVRVRGKQADPIAVIESAIVTIVREFSLASTQERLIAQAGVSVERAGFGVLRCISEHGDLRVSDLAQLLGVDTSTMSRHVKTLERDGLLTREGDPLDRRSARVGLTSSGTEVLELLRVARHEFFAELLGDWAEHDREALAPLLAQFAGDVLVKAGRV